MKKFKLSVFFSIVLISLLIIGAVSATSTDEVVSSDDSSTIDDVVNTASGDEIITIDESDDAISDGDSAGTLENDPKPGSFTDLNGKIIDAIENHDGVLNLTYDFAFDEEVDWIYLDGIIIGGTSSLTINGNNHTINAGKFSAIFNIEVENVVTFNNITFANATSGAIYNIGSKLFINNCTFINNINFYDGAPDEGGAISTTDGDLIVSDSVFINNSGADGGAIFAETDSVTVNNCVFINNTATGDGFDPGTGGAIKAGTSTLTVNNCVFTNNSASTTSASADNVPHGGAINTAGLVNITNSNFTDNSAEEGGALKVLSGGDVSATVTTIDNCIFINNTAREGGAIYNYNCMLEINNSQFKENIVQENGAIYTNLESIINIQSSTFDDSIIYIADDSKLCLSNNNISSTKAEIVSEGIIISTINIIVLGNSTVTARIGDEVTLTAKVTDDNGNLIKDANLTLVVDGVEIDTVYNDTSNLYQANYTVETAGSKIVNMTYHTTDNLVTSIGILYVKFLATIDVIIEEVPFYEEVEVTAILPEDATDHILVYVDNMFITSAPIISGISEFPIYGFEAGKHYLTIIYGGDDKYDNASYSTEFFTGRAPTNTTINVTIDGFDVEITVNVNSSIAVNGGNVTLTFNNQNTTANVVDGVAVFKFTHMYADTYPVVAYYDGNDKFMPSNAASSAKVVKATPKLTAKAKTYKYEDKIKKYKVTLKDEKGRVMKNKKVTLKVNGKTYTAKTNSKGVATFKLTKLKKKGTFKAVITYAGDKYYKKVTKKVNIKVKAPAWKTVAKGSKKKATVKKIQRALKNNGYYLTYQGRYLKIDGLYNSCTERSVKEFQKDKGLKVTGKVDYATAKKLKIVK